MRLLQMGRFSSSVRATFGAAYGYVPDSAYNIPDQTKFAALIGNNQTQKNLRFSVGPVFHFGGEN